uniref:VP11 n=1 Tax=viral metagenome TaxID=1070528 RepID=A0A6C0CJW0_9ZZZZ
MPTSKDNGWTDKEEIILKNWGETALLDMAKHKETARWFSALNKFLTMPHIIISTVITVLSMIKDHINVDDALIISGILSAIVIGWEKIKQLFNYEERSSKHKVTADAYYSISNAIGAQLSMSRNDRERGITFINKIREKLDDTAANADPIPSKVEQKFYTKKKENSDQSPPQTRNVGTYKSSPISILKHPTYRTDIKQLNDADVDIDVKHIRFEIDKSRMQRKNAVTKIQRWWRRLKNYQYHPDDVRINIAEFHESPAYPVRRKSVASHKYANNLADMMTLAREASKNAEDPTQNDDAHSV